jgi:ADP-heptose:LPS heptosyltransferase
MHLCNLEKYLIIQTAFIGDVVLATCVLEKLHQYFPDAKIDFLLRKGNEDLFSNHPFLGDILIWDKKQNKQQNLWKLLLRIRKTKYDKVINIQRFAATGLLTAFSGAKETIGFDKNPLSVFFSRKIKHEIEGEEVLHHEIERDLALIRDFTDDRITRPRLYPSQTDYDMVKPYQQNTYITISPASIWFTKQYPKDKWVSFIDKLPPDTGVYLLGAKSDFNLCWGIIEMSKQKTITNLCGKLSFLQSAALMEKAQMNYVNDSAPMHFASAVNAPTTAVFCSTIPGFGFGPLSDKRYIVEINQPLSCRPCGLHGYKACPLGHFDCAKKIADEQLLGTMEFSAPH